MFCDYEAQVFFLFFDFDFDFFWCIVPLHCYFIVVPSSFFSFIIVVFHYCFDVTLSHCCWFSVVSSCCCSITLLFVHGYYMLLFAYGSSLSFLFVCGYSLALLLVCHFVVIGPSSHNYGSYVMPSHSYYYYVVIFSNSSTMPNSVPIRFVIVTLLLFHVFG
jgi:hypothetical protein